MNSKFNLRFGNCINHKELFRIGMLKQTGFDYAEIPLASVFDSSSNEISDFLTTLEMNDMRCEAANVLFKGDIRLTGNNVDFSVVDDYLKKLFEKTKDFGFEIVVFGSGGARKIPEGFPKEEAIKQIVFVCGELLAPYAEKYNFTVAIEELNKGETNLINTLNDAEEIISRCTDKYGAKCAEKIKITADFFHMSTEGDSLNNMNDISRVAHCHTANPAGRFYNRPDDEASLNGQFAEFFRTLKNSGYNGRMSIEGSVREKTLFASYLKENEECLAYLKQMRDEA